MTETFTPPAPTPSAASTAVSAASTAVSSTPTTLRRVPKQARARERLERLLDAAEAVFVEVGYDVATTNQIASRAGTSIGSLYEFFPNKQAVAIGLANRYLADLGSVYSERIVNDPALTGEILIESIVDALSGFWRRHPAVAALLRGALGAPELVAAGEALRVGFVDHIAAILAARRPQAALEHVRFVAEMTFDLTRALLERAQAEPLHKRAAVITELKRVLFVYLRSAVGPPPTATPSS